MLESVALNYFGRNSDKTDLVKKKKTQHKKPMPFPVTESRIPFHNLPSILLQEKEHLKMIQLDF